MDNRGHLLRRPGCLAPRTQRPRRDRLATLPLLPLSSGQDVALIRLPIGQIVVFKLLSAIATLRDVQELLILRRWIKSQIAKGTAWNRRAERESTERFEQPWTGFWRHGQGNTG